MFFPLQFSTLNTLQHTPFLYVSIPPHIVLVSSVNFRKKSTVQICVQSEPKSVCSWTRVVLHCADSVQVPHKERNHKIPTLTISVISAIHWHSHSNPNPTTDSWTVIFPSLCTSDTHDCTQHFRHPIPQTHNTVYNACYSKAHKKRFTSLKKFRLSWRYRFKNSEVRHVVVTY
jgi:hypothetical protein